MSQLRSIVKSFVPPRYRRFLRRAQRDFRPRRLLRAAQRAFVFRRAMHKFLQCPEAYAQPGNPVMADLIFGWGNEGWSALDEYLAGCMAHALKANGPILECGSGLSTILVGTIAKRRGLSHWALEHTPEWAARVRRYIRRYNIDSVTLCVHPLKDYGAFGWYAPPWDSMPERFSLVICDGPPGATKGGRYGLAPVMRERLERGCVVLLDDTSREREHAIALRWGTELESFVEMLGSEKPYCKLTVKSARLPQTAAMRAVAT